MDLYLIRHAEALPHGTPAFAENARPLTDLGHDQAKRLGELFLRLEIRLDAIVTSPLVRAGQTTDGILTQLAEPRPQVLTFDEIGGEMRPRRVGKYLAKLDRPAVAIVGHQPTLGAYVAWLIGSKKAHIEMEKAGFAWVACESFDKGGGILQWLITPDWF